MSDLAMQAKGRWRSILPALGIDAEHLSGKHGPCPACAGSDRFRFDDKESKGTFFCNQCGAGDGIKLVMLVRGWTFPEAAREIEKLIGVSPIEAGKAGPDPKKVRDGMNAIWKASHDLSSVEATRLWWMNRLGQVPRCPDLRAVEELYHAETKRRFPAMVALLRGVDGKPVNMHRTFLTAAGNKAPITSPRMMMPLEIPKGAAVRLGPHMGRLGIAEGIETAMASTALTGIPCWAGLTANGVGNWQPPEGVRITVFADNDASYTGASSSYCLARRLVAQGFDVDVQIPHARGEDFCDVWTAAREMGHSPANDTPAQDAA